MVRIFLRTSAAIVLAAALGSAAAPALADGTVANPFGSSIVPSANLAIKNALNARVPKPKPSVADGTLAQVPPISQPPVGGPEQQGLPVGFTYTADLSVAYPYGNIGSFGKKELPGGADVVAGYGFKGTDRIIASYYTLQHYPYGFNSGTVPLFVQGLPNSIGCVDLGGGTANGCTPVASPINVTTSDKFFFLNYEHLFVFQIKDKILPLVVTPTYTARYSTVAASNGNGDVVPFESNGFPQFGVNTRTAQIDSVAFTLPFLKTPKMFGTFTVAPAWLVHRSGVNIENKAQLYQILYIEYNPNPRTKIFVEPQSSRDYLPTDVYAQHLNAYFAGVSEQITRNSFVQLVLNGGGPSNYKPYGVSALTCQQVGNCAATTVPTVGGLKATQLQIQFGIGSPSVIQF